MSTDRRSVEPALPADGTPGATAGLWSPRWRATSLSMLLSIGVVAFDELGVTTALPRVAAELGGLSTYGWAISVVVLATLMGSAVSGQLADRRGPAVPSAVGFGVFAVGLILSGVASSWTVFLLGRAIQGLGAGAVVAMVYVVLMRRLPTELRSRALALVSSAWMIPSLVGPAASGLLTDTVGWRAIFGMLLGLSLLAAVASMLVNRSLDAPDRPDADDDDADDADRSGTVSALAATGWSGALVLAVSVLLGALEFELGWVAGLLGAVGAVGAVVALRQLVPPGTLRLGRGLPAGVASRFLLAVG